MPTSPGTLRADEFAAVGVGTTDPLLRALELAIHVEETVSIVLPDSMLDPTRLGSPQDFTMTVAALLEGR